MSFEETIYQLFARKSSPVTALNSFTKHSFKCKELLRNVQTQQISDRIIYYTTRVDISTYAMDIRILSSRQEACSLSTMQRVEVVVVDTVGVSVISVSLCKQEMTVKDGIIS